MLAVANTGSCVGPHNYVGYHARRIRRLVQIFRVVCPRNTNKLQNMYYSGSRLAFRNCAYGFDFPREIGVFNKNILKKRGGLCCIGFLVKYFNRSVV